MLINFKTTTQYESFDLIRTDTRSLTCLQSRQQTTCEYDLFEFDLGFCHDAEQ